MNVIVKRHYPANRLPADLRADLPEGAMVEVQITREDTDVAPLVRLSELVGTGNNVHGGEEEMLSWIRQGREDRDP